MSKDDMLITDELGIKFKPNLNDESEASFDSYVFKLSV